MILGEMTGGAKAARVPEMQAPPILGPILGPLTRAFRVKPGSPVAA